MRIALVADTFPPLRNSGAIQLQDLVQEFVRQGHSICVILPAPGQNNRWQLEHRHGAEILRLRAPRTKDLNHARRAMAEVAMSFVMLRNMSKSPFPLRGWEGVVWYSPSIFHGPLVSALKRASGCQGYLIVRDIFPEWAADVGLMSRGLLYKIFKWIAAYQYSLADVIGVQTYGNKHYFVKWVQRRGRVIEVLQNWASDRVPAPCPIRLDKTCLAGRKIFVYAGNMGMAQRIDIFFDLADRFEKRTDVGFLFVGRGSEVPRLKNLVKARSLSNTLIYDEIEPEELTNLYAQCTAGIVALDPKHKTHNIPGKFLTYIQHGLPVLANINRGNDLALTIVTHGVGRVSENNNLDELFRLAELMLFDLTSDPNVSARCRNLFEREFRVENAVRQIVSALNPQSAR